MATRALVIVVLASAGLLPACSGHGKKSTEQTAYGICERVGGFAGGTETGGGVTSSCNGARAEASEKALAKCIEGTQCSADTSCRDSTRHCRPILGGTTFSDNKATVGCEVDLTYRCECSCQ